ncbi:hypothetical protein QFZ71_003006 [Streptomyces sp. V2I9]|nr:hypothetical protein [Streptomyces sp. V2I9]
MDAFLSTALAFPAVLAGTVLRDRSDTGGTAH